MIEERTAYASARRVDWHAGEIDDKVANLSEEVVLIGVPICSIPTRNIWIRVDDG